MDVIGAGFGRTGTRSLKEALDRLGVGPCMHMQELFDDPERGKLFQRAAQGEPDQLEKAFDGYRSTVDWPGTFFWRELVEKYPRAKVVLTVRDPQQWYDSVSRTIYVAANLPQPPPGAPPGLTVIRSMTKAVVWDGQFGGRFADRDHAVRVFEEHNEAVRRGVPADRLLEYRVDEGWEPLCAFLGRPVPDEPFPRLNDTAQFQARVAEHNAR